MAEKISRRGFLRAAGVLTGGGLAIIAAPVLAGSTVHGEISPKREAAPPTNFDELVAKARERRLLKKAEKLTKGTALKYGNDTEWQTRPISGQIAPVETFDRALIEAEVNNDDESFYSTVYALQLQAAAVDQNNGRLPVATIETSDRPEGTNVVLPDADLTRNFGGVFWLYYQWDGVSHNAPVYPEGYQETARLSVGNEGGYIAVGLAQGIDPTTSQIFTSRQANPEWGVRVQ